MALQFIKKIDRVINYDPYVKKPGAFVYNPYLIAGIRSYAESIKNIKQFFYSPAYDRYVAYATLDYVYWPGWRMKRYTFYGRNGRLAGVTNMDVLFSLWTNHISAGGENLCYGTGAAFLDVREVDWHNNTWGGFKCYDWEGRQPPVFHQAIVNRNDALVVGNGLDLYFHVYDFVQHELKGRIASLWTTYNSYMCYESDSHFWVVYGTGQLIKINYKTYKYELISKVQDPEPTDISYRCAFDTNRRRLAVLRHKPDGDEGSCRVRLELYHPVPQPSLITAPVPVNQLRGGAEICFAGHVLGDGGEGIAASAVTASLADPAHGSLQSGLIRTGSNGAYHVSYHAPDANIADTLNVETNVETNGETNGETEE